MVDDPKDKVTEGEKKILRGLPYGEHPFSKKILYYLDKNLFSKETDKQLSEHSLAFKAAIIEVLNICGDIWNRQFQNFPHTQQRNRKLIVDFSTKMFAALSDEEVKPVE